MEINDISRELRNKCIELYQQLEKDEDGFVVFNELNNEGENIIYLKEAVYNNCVLREITAIRFEGESLRLYEEKREKEFTMGIYEESPYEIYSKLYTQLLNQL